MRASSSAALLTRTNGVSDGPLSAALPNVQRALKILEEREVSPQVGLLKSTLLQLDPTFSERDYGAGTFLEFMQKMERARLVHLRRTERGHLVEAANGGGEAVTVAAVPVAEPAGTVETAAGVASDADAPRAATATTATTAEAMRLLRQTVLEAGQKSPGKPLYLRQISQALRGVGLDYDSRRHGFRAILDLLHEAQRAGILRLHRDHKGTWRVFPLATAPAPSQESAEAAALEPESVTEAAPAAAGEPWVEEIPQISEPVEVHAEAGRADFAGEPPPEPPAPEKKVRKSRARAGTKGPPRKPSQRRKSKEPAGE